MSEIHKHHADPTTSSSAWRLAATMAVLSGVVLAVFHWQGGDGREDRPGGAMAEATRQIPRVPFKDITAVAGIDFVHENGAAGEKLLPETMGSGVAFFDFDNDGDQDLLFVNGHRWPWDEEAGQSHQTTAVLYRNDSSPEAGIRFVDVTRDSGLDVPIYGMGVAIGDVDADGLLDVYLTAVGPNHLFRNLGNGKFVDVTEGSRTAGNPDEWGTSAAFLDYDLDGDLDLFVCNYVVWSRELDLQLDFQFAGLGRSYGPPHGFRGSFPILFRNNGSGIFDDVSAESGVQIRNRVDSTPMAKSLGVSPVDMDGDGWIDLVVANDTVQNFVFHNQGDGTFVELGARSGIGFDPNGATRGAMGIDSAFSGGPDQLAIAIGNFANENTALYLAQREPLLFSDEALAAGISELSRSALTFGVFFFDYDLDGREDLLTVNGHIENEIEKLGGDQRYRQPMQLFWNNGAQKQAARFLLCGASETEADFQEPLAGRGSAFADIDLDGDLDVVVTQVGGAAILFENGLNPEKWCRIELRGTQGNRWGVGANIVFPGSGRRMVNAARGYLSSSDPAVVVPQRIAKAKEVEVFWPVRDHRHSRHTLENGQNVVVFGGK